MFHEGEKEPPRRHWTTQLYFSLKKTKTDLIVPGKIEFNQEPGETVFLQIA
jgi:hypothetical protein